MIVTTPRRWQLLPNRQCTPETLAAGWTQRAQPTNRWYKLYRLITPTKSETEYHHNQPRSLSTLCTLHFLSLDLLADHRRGFGAKTKQTNSSCSVPDPGVSQPKRPPGGVPPAGSLQGRPVVWNPRDIQRPVGGPNIAAKRWPGSFPGRRYRRKGPPANSPHSPQGIRAQNPFLPETRSLGSRTVWWSTTYLCYCCWCWCYV